jgi:hypothetical protein
MEDAVVVCDDQHRHALLARELLHPVHDVPAGLPVERRGGLVGEHDAGLGDECARDGHPLPLAESWLG